MSFFVQMLNIRGNQRDVTLASFLVKQLQQSDPACLDWPQELSHVTKCAGYSVKAVGAEIDGEKKFKQKYI